MAFDSTAGYHQIKKETALFLKDFGFKPYKTAYLYRIEGDFLQFLIFQKGYKAVSGTTSFNFVIKGLFAPYCNFQILMPGAQLGRMMEKPRDGWLDCTTEQDFAAVDRLLDESVQFAKEKLKL